MQMTVDCEVSLEDFDTEEVVEELEERGFIVFEADCVEDVVFGQLDELLICSTPEQVEEIYEKVLYHYGRNKK